MICPSLEMSRVSNIFNIVLKGESRVGEGRGPARSGRKQEVGRKRERVPGGGGDGEIIKKLFVTGSESQNVSQVESFYLPFIPQLQE